MNLLRDCQDVYKRTVILVTHNMEYLPLADHLLHIEDGDVKQMKSDSIRETTAALFEDMRQRIERLSKTRENHATKN
jgi:ABC-type sulfate/molybdate transport systems ATPase subunit